MKFRNNRKNIIIGIVLLLIVTISIGYAALSSNLTIKGNSGIKDNRWLIYFDNVVPTNEAVITNAEKTNIDFGVNFELPGDYYEFDVDIKNDGTIDAAINEVFTSGLSEEQKEYMTFEVKYQNGTFNFYDGKIVVSTNAKPEITTEVEYNFEATTHIDTETGYEYCVLEYLLDPLSEESA